MVCETPKSLKQVPVTCSICMLLTIVFLMYGTQQIKKPCGNDVVSIALSNFVTIDVAQLIINLYTMYALSYLEVQLGSARYLKLIVLSIGLNTGLEWGVHKKYTDLPCSLGFSGVIVSLILISITMNKNINVWVLSVLIIFSMYLTLRDSNSVSKYIGHVVGAVSGLMLGLMVKNDYL
jgi:membrane associated rhomboid family serine protease